jgi:hypothetical protein
MEDRPRFGSRKNIFSSLTLILLILSHIYAFFFDQKGLMGGLGLQGTKITKVDKL